MMWTVGGEVRGGVSFRGGGHYFGLLFWEVGYTAHRASLFWLFGSLENIT